MSDSSDDSGNFIEIPYSKRPEWADIQPIFQVNKIGTIFDSFLLQIRSLNFSRTKKLTTLYE